MDLPGEWPSEQAPVPYHWDDHLSDSSSDNGGVVFDLPIGNADFNENPEQQDQTSNPTQTQVQGQYQDQQQNASMSTVSLDRDGDRNQNEGEDDMMPRELLPKPQPLSSWTGSAFNKPTTFYGTSVARLMPQEEIEQTRNFELYRLHSVRFELNQGDTLVFIDYPAYNNINHTDCNGVIYKSQEFRVHSGKLLETGSSKFTEMLNSTYQFRIQRRRKMVNRLPEGIKYLLDLTPPSEGDDLVFQMTELSLTPAIIKWWSSYMIHGVDPLLVTGHDDVCSCSRRPKSPTTEDKEDNDSEPVGTDTEATGHVNYDSNGKKLPSLPLSSERALQMKATNDNEVYVTPPYRNIQDYCPIRHRNGIVRLLMLIEGKGIILDSAHRLWTMVKLSAIFDCASVIRDRATQWIMHGQNTTFIEVLPEEALQIAFSLKIPQVAESSFRILVNELALKLADKESHKEPSQTTIFGRKEGYLPDELSNLVQHAAQALVDRVSDINATMRNVGLYDFWDIYEWDKLRKIEQLLEQEDTHLSREALAKVRLLMDALIYEVTQTWDEVMTSPPEYNHFTYSSIDEDRLSYVEPKDFEKATIIMRDFNPIQMLLCAVPYNDVGVILDSRRWHSVSVKCKLAGYRDKKYTVLVREASVAVYEYLACHPKLAGNPYWKNILRDRPFPLMGAMAVAYKPIVSLDAIELGVKKEMAHITLSWSRNMIEPPPHKSRHLLLTLSENELKYLPLWCGGCDDGTGGVFEEPIPETSMGANGPGPGYHTGHTLPSAPSSVSGSIIEDMDALRVWGSTTSASINVHDSISTVYRPDQVITPDRSIASDSFTVGGSEFSNARYAVPADHQAMGEAVNMVVETMDSEPASSTMTDGWNTPNDDSDDDVYMWNADSDSDDSTATIS
ncbi:hypothetical protein FGRMN_10393 [Fusarium graminum]|nr:hypothetical protein FGRMN_10393 [Fusarium graminum]